MRDNGLEVILVNTQSDEKKPSKARAMAQTNLAGGGDMVTKLLTAAKAGNPPDLAQVEYQSLPTLVSNEVLADIRNYLGTRWSGAVDWTPLQNRLELFPEVSDALPDDPWQFDAFRANV